MKTNGCTDGELLEINLVTSYVKRAVFSQGADHRRSTQAIPKAKF